MVNISCISCGHGLEYQNLGNLVCDRTVLDAPRHDREFAWTNLKHPIPELDSETPSNTEKQFVLMLVEVPHEVPFELGKLYLLTIEFSHDFWPPVFCNEREFLGEVNLLHRCVLLPLSPTPRQESASNGALGGRRSRP
jgi:hypothetical protein